MDDPDGDDRPRVAVLLAGGTGTRLYPASRRDRPKQFLALDGERTLLERTADRARRFADETYVVTRDRYADRVRELVPDAAVLVEPVPRDTGPALVYAAHRIRAQVGPCTLCCLPSDHHVGDGFAETARRACDVAARTGDLVTLGVDPDRPATGYGYVEPGRDRDGYAEVASFHEKPDRETARSFVDRGFYWNAGVFAWTPAALLREARDSPLASLVSALDDGDAAAGFEAAPATSVDYAVLERTDRAAVVRADFAWDDLGTWDAVGRLLDGENAVLGEALAVDARDNVLASDDKHVSAVGVEGLVVAAFDDRVLVVPRDRADEVRAVVDRLREDGRF